MKEIIYQFSKHNARNAQHVQFATDVLNAVPEETATAQGFASQRAVLATAAADELDCFQPDKAYLGTPEIESTDRRRDTVFLFYKAIANAYADYCPDADKQQAGATVAFAFREAGKASELDYASETAVLSDLVGKLGEDPYAAALAEIGLSDAPTVIAEANDAFNAVYLKRSAEERDRKLVGKSRFAPLTGGFGSTISWKGLTVSADFTWAGKKYLWSNENYFTMNAASGAQYNQAKEMLNIWTTPGQVTDIPAATETIQADDHLLENASFMRLKNLTVQYALPKSVLKHLGDMQNISLFFTGRNLWTVTQYTGYDPEPDTNLVKFGYPNTRQFVFGAEVTF